MYVIKTLIQKSLYVAAAGSTQQCIKSPVLMQNLLLEQMQWGNKFKKKTDSNL